MADKLTCPNLSHLFINKHTISPCKIPSLLPLHNHNKSGRHGPRAVFRLVSQRLLPLLVFAITVTLRYDPATASTNIEQLTPTSSVSKLSLINTPISLYSTRASAAAVPASRNVAANIERSYPVHYTTTPASPTVISTQYNLIGSPAPQQGAAATTTIATTGYPAPTRGYTNIQSTSSNLSYIASAIGFSSGAVYSNDNQSQASGPRHYQLTKPSPRLQQPQLAPVQPKSYKFTLVAGKYWRFNIKSNSLTSSSQHSKNKELRLHRNISNTNFIIDDDGWFQYNPSQQQLFAWPSLLIKPATYYFVLMPVEQDIEPSEDENGVNNIEIAASIVVELIRPMKAGNRANEIPQLFDYSFSLDNVHRQSSYVLLLNQIITFFDYLSAPSRPAQDPTSDPQQIHPMISSSNQQVINKYAGLPKTNYNKLSEYLLINSYSHTNTQYFSLTWTYEPSLINNTITTHANECRLNSLLDVLKKLSKPTLASPEPPSQTPTTNPSEKPELVGRSSFGSVIYYPVRLQWSQTTINPLGEAGRSELVLKLTLNNQCKQPGVLDEIVGGSVRLSSGENSTAREINLSFLINSAVNLDDKISGKSDQSDLKSNLQQLQQQNQQSISTHKSPQTSSPVLTSTLGYAIANPGSEGTSFDTSDNIKGRKTSIADASDQNVTKTPTIPRYALELTASTLPTTSTTSSTSSISNATSPYLEVPNTELPINTYPLNSQPPSQTTTPSTTTTTITTTTAVEAASSSVNQHWLTAAHDNQLNINEQQRLPQQQQQRPSSLPHEEVPAKTSTVDPSLVPTASTTFISNSQSFNNNVNINATDGPADKTTPKEPAQSFIGDDRRQSIISVSSSPSSTSKTPPQAKSFANFFDIVETITDTSGGNLIPSSTETMTTAQVHGISSNTATSEILNISTIESDADGSTTAINATSIPSSSPANESSLNEDLIGILNNITEYIVSVAVPVSIIIGAILLLSIIIALCSLRAKRKKSQQFEVGDRFKHRYGSERKAFLKNSSRPVILEADQKSLSTGGTPQHFVQQNKIDDRKTNDSVKGKSNYLKMTRLSHGSKTDNGSSAATSFWLGSGGAGQTNISDKRDPEQPDS